KKIIAAKPRNPRRGPTRRTSARAQVLGNAGPSPRVRANAAANVAAKAAAQTSPTEKIIVSNLPIDVNEAQIKELFAQTVGPLKEVTLHYDQNGRSKGVASVHFQRKGDGTKAFQQYNNRLIDGTPVRSSLSRSRSGWAFHREDVIDGLVTVANGDVEVGWRVDGSSLDLNKKRNDGRDEVFGDFGQLINAPLCFFPCHSFYNYRITEKPMKIEIVVAPAPVSLAQRVSPADGATATNGVARTGGRGRRSRAGRNRKERPQKSAADLDAEMEDYTASNAPAATAAPAAA
ncbi:mRNA export protein mlo3, partial [Termitomyces sp. J132]